MPPCGFTVFCWCPLGPSPDVPPLCFSSFFLSLLMLYLSLPSFYQIQASHLLHAGGLKWEKGQAAACRWVLCCSGWEERKDPREIENLQSDWQLGRGQFGLANFGFRQIWGSGRNACCPCHWHFMRNKENVELSVHSIGLTSLNWGVNLKMGRDILYSDVIRNGKRKLILWSWLELGVLGSRVPWFRTTLSILGLLRVGLSLRGVWRDQSGCAVID